MKYYQVALVKSARSASVPLTYSYEDDLPVGTLVDLKVRDQKELGVVLGSVVKPKFKTKNIDNVLKEQIDSSKIKLARWISQYYQAPVGVCARLMIPTGMQTKRRQTGTETTSQLKPILAKDSLTKDQAAAVKALSVSNNTSLLHGVTGSGKTRVYIELAKQAFLKKKSVVVLVPEIALTSQLVEQFRLYFKSVIVTHSNMTESERHHAWNAVYNADQPIVVIGPRSALFMPVNNLGLVMIDECHDDSYKQSNSPRYNALKVARKLCDIVDAKLILGSATPAITDYYVAKKLGAVVTLSQPIKTTAGRNISLIDMRKEKQTGALSKEAINKIKLALENSEQVLVYHNRRGTSPLVICSKCSWTAKCPNCHIPMVLHHDTASLNCHNCGTKNKLPTSCPTCGNTDIVYRGLGTKKIEQELKSTFKNAIVARYDTDNRKSESLAQTYQDVYEGKIDILVGTQMIAKGLDLPKLSTGIVVLADTGLSMPDFTANEKVFQLLHQVIGRVGRHSKKSYVGIQTFAPENHIIKLAMAQDYDNFYEQALLERKEGAYPPFKHLLLLTCSYASRTSAKNRSQNAAKLLAKLPGVEVVGPAPSFREQLGSKYRWQILAKSSSREKLINISQEFVNKTSWTIDIDPVSLL